MQPVSIVEPEQKPTNERQQAKIREGVIKGMENGYIRIWRSSTDEEFLNLEAQLLAADGQFMQEAVDLAREGFDRPKNRLLRSL